MRHYDLDIWIDAQAIDHYPTRANSETMGECHGKLLSSEVEHARSVFEKLSSKVPEAELQHAGSLLFNALLSGPVGNLYQQALGQVYTDKNAGVRVRLRIEPPEVASLAWELLYDSDRECFLATSSETLLTRYIELHKPIRELQTEPPIRVLVVIPAGSGLDVENEKQKILNSLAKLNDLVEIRILEGEVTSARISDELVLAKYHILHFIGHGGFRNDKGCLRLNGERVGESDLVTAKEFSLHFQDHPYMKLIVLNSCSGAESSNRSLTGVAQELVRMGVPVVIAMREEISDKAAKLFAENFYYKLCRGFERGRVDIAISHARKRMMQELADNPEFANPALFMRSPQGVIFNLDEAAVGTDVRELHTLKAVKRTHDYNIEQIKNAGGEDATIRIEKETEAQSRISGRVTQFYKRIAISAAPRVAAMTLVVAVLFTLASHTRFLNAFRVDDYFSGALRYWSDTPDKPFSPHVKIILANENDNGSLGKPEGNVNWRAYHAEIIRGLTAVEKKPSVIALDLSFNVSAPDDLSFAEKIKSARAQKISVVVGQQVDNDGRITDDSRLTPVLAEAFGDRWGDVEVGGMVQLPLFPKIGAYINQYEVASLPPNTTNLDGEVSVIPSLALRSVMQALGSEDAPARASYNELTQTVTLKTVNSDQEVGKPIPVVRNGLSLEMLMEYSPEQDIKNALSSYHEVYQWARENNKEQLERRFGNKIVLVGYNNDMFAIIGQGRRPGVAIHANAVSNILNGQYIPQISPARNFVIILFMVGLGVSLQTYLRRRLPGNIHLKIPYVSGMFGEIHIPAVLIATLVLYFLIAYLAYSRSRVSFDMSYHLAALLFGYWLIAIFRKKLRLN